MSDPLAPRRRPNFAAFLATGAVLGFALGGYLAWSGVLEKPSTVTGGTPVYAASSGVGYLGLLGAVVFALLAGVVAVLLDRSGRD